MKYKGYALMLLRIVLAFVFLYHGWAKVGDMTGTVGFFASIGLSPFWTYVAAYVEVIVGVMLLIGWNTRIAATVGGIIMLVAIYKVHWSHGYNSMAGGYEYQLLLLTNLVYLFVVGAGRYSIDDTYGTCMLENSGFIKDSNR